MAVVSTFGPQGPCYLVVASAVQILGSSTAANCSAYRVRNLSTTAQYFSYGTTSAVTSVGSPSAGVPSAGTIGMLGSSVESFTLPSNVWMIADNATGFEVSPGEGV